MNDILKISGTLSLKDNNDITKKLLDFLEQLSIEFSGFIGDNYINTVKQNIEIPLDTLKLSTRVKNILYNNNIFSLDELGTYYKEDIEAFKGMGSVSFKELEIALSKYNIHLVSFLEETTDFKKWSYFERRTLHLKNVRTLEKLYSLSDAELARLFYQDTYLYKRLVKKRKRGR